MKKRKLPLLLAALLGGQVLLAQSNAVIKNYIAQFKDIAIEEMKRTGVPASITLAQGIHETSAGQSPLVLRSNNHFGIKCKSEWKGPSVSHDDDAPGECFRKYESPFESYRDHSDFLKNRSHYSFLFQIDPADYESWAHGLKKAGYATNPKYPQILIKLIRDYNLHDYTLMAMGRKENTPELWASATEPAAQPTEVVSREVEAMLESDRPAIIYPSGVFRINETDVLFVRKGTSFLALAQQYSVPLARLFEFNDLPQSEEAVTDGLVFLQRKRKTGVHDFHTVAPGETVHAIAQAEGMRLESLLEYNLLQKGMQPEVGEVLNLQRTAPSRPRLAGLVAQLRRPERKEEAASVLEDEEKGNSSPYTVHTVQPKETVYSISRKYAVLQEEIMEWNNLATPELKTGQQLRILKKSMHGR